MGAMQDLAVTNDWISFRRHLDRYGHMTELRYRVDNVDEKGVRVRLAAGHLAYDIVMPRDDKTFLEVQDVLQGFNASRINDVMPILKFFA